MKNLTKKEMKRNENIARDILAFLKENGYWFDIIIYFNNKAWSTSKKWKGEYGKIISEPISDNFEIIEGVYEYENKNPLNYLEYANCDTISISFEGPIYKYLNYMDSEAFQKVLDKHNAYYELGHAWNLSIYFN